MVVCECNGHSTKTRTVRKFGKKITHEKVNASMRLDEQLLYHAKNEEMTQERTPISAKKNVKKNIKRQPNQPQPDIPVSPETGKISLFKTKDYNTSVLIRPNAQYYLCLGRLRRFQSQDSRCFG